MIHACIPGDCRTIDPTTLGHAVEITDPPYGAHVHSRATSAAAGGVGTRQRNLGFAHLSDDLREYVARAAACARRWSVIYTDLEGARDWRDALDAAIDRRGGSAIRTIPIVAGAPDEIADTDGGTVGLYPWIRWAGPQQSGDRPPSGCEAIVLAHVAGPMRWGGPGNLTHLEHKCLRGLGKHTTEKPLDQALDLVAWHTDPGDLVYDPCAGRGTIGVACVLLGRQYVGVESQATEAAAATARIEAAKRGGLSDRDAERLGRWATSLDVHLMRIAATPVNPDLTTRGADWARTVQRFAAGRPTLPADQWLSLARQNPFTKGLPLCC